MVRSGDAKIDCRIAGARCSENGGSDDEKITTEAFSLEIAGGLLEGGLRVCALREEKQIPNLRATERTRLLRPNSRISWKKRARNMMHENHSRFERRKMVAKKDEGAFGGGSLAREEEG